MCVGSLWRDDSRTLCMAGGRLVQGVTGVWLKVGQSRLSSDNRTLLQV